ncbi:hypothetical protein BS17DRAFT_768724 [Gyrodon lividus]|nr:hypothetical protein BS17DRAFT_768724 [Gyrodon lividus]
MRITQALVFLVCTSYAFATRCAACAEEIGDLLFLSKCYKPTSAGQPNKPVTTCTYEEKAGIVTGVDCTYDQWGKLVQSDSVGECIGSVPVNSQDCPPCFTKDHVTTQTTLTFKSTNTYDDSSQRPNALAIVRDGKISFIDFLSQVLDPSEKEFKAYRMAIYLADDNSPPELYQLFNSILNDPRGGPLFRRWIEDQAVDIVSSKVYDEMDDVKDALRGTIGTITPEFLMTWDINSTMDRIFNKSAPTLKRLLGSASQTDRARRENTKKTSTTCIYYVLHQRELG